MDAFVEALRRLHLLAGAPTYRSLARKTEGSSEAYISSSSISEVFRANNPKPPSYGFVGKFVSACGGSDAEVRAFERAFIAVTTAARARDKAAPGQRVDASARQGIDEEHRMTLELIAEVADSLEGDVGHEVARGLYEHIYDVCRRLLGDSHERTEQATRDLGIALAEVQHYTRASELLEQALVAYTARYGVEHPNTLAIMDNLAIVQIGRERYDRAISLASQVLAARKRNIDEPSEIRHTADILIRAFEEDENEHAADQIRQEFTTKTPPRQRMETRGFLRRRNGNRAR